MANVVEQKIRAFILEQYGKEYNLDPEDPDYFIKLNIAKEEEGFNPGECDQPDSCPCCGRDYDD